MPDVDTTAADDVLSRTERERLVALANAEQQMELALAGEKQATAEIKRLSARVEYGGGTYQEQRMYQRAVAQKLRMTQVYELAAADAERLRRM